MDVPTVIVILVIVVAPIGLMVLLELRDRRSRHVPPVDGGENDDSLREAARTEQENAASRGKAAGMAYGSGIDGNAP